MKLTMQDLQIILQEGEGQTIEFKESFNPSIVKEIVAFANAIGGRVFVGVSDSGQIKGINVNNSLKSQIVDIARNCDPPISVGLQILDNVLLITVEEGSNKPYQCKDGFFLRQGPNAQKLTRDQIIQFCIDETKIRFDTQLNTKFRYPQDFDKNLFKQYVEEIKVSAKHSTEDILINLGVAQKNLGKVIFNNAGVLFFAKEPCKFFQSAYVDAVVFKGTERIDVIDRKIFKNGLLENLDNTRIYLQEHLNVKYEYREDWKRENIYELPLDALREAVANALMHRDYFISGANITVAIFDDRVEIASPGGLPKPLTIKDLGRISKRRNETISDLFSRLEYVEKLGTGINKIRNWMKEAGLKVPVVESNGFFLITFYRDRSKILIKNGGRTAIETTPNTTFKTTPKIDDVILDDIKENPRIKKEQLAKKFDMTNDGIKYHIRKLTEKGIIKWSGSSKLGHWEILKDKNEGKTATENTLKTTPKTTPKFDEAILNFIKGNPEIKKEQLAKKFDMTVDGIKYHIRKLTKKGIIKWSGSSKLGHWEIL